MSLAARLVIAALVALGLAYGALSAGKREAPEPLDRAPLERVELPGFSIALPSGTIDHDLSYAGDRVVFEHVAGHDGMVWVSWDMGELATQADLQNLVEVFGRANKATLPMNLASAVSTVTTIVAIDGTAMLSAVPCGTRSFIVGIGADVPVVALHERVMQSIVCKPDPEQESKLRVGMPFSIELPGWYASSGWYTDDEPPGYATITDGNTVLEIREDVPEDFDLQELVDDWLDTMRSQSNTFEGKILGRVADRINVSYTADGRSERGWALLKPCPRIAFVTAIGSDDATLDMLYERVEAARCLRTNEPPPTWPASPPRQMPGDDATADGVAPGKAARPSP